MSGPDERHGYEVLRGDDAFCTLVLPREQYETLLHGVPAESRFMQADAGIVNLCFYANGFRLMIVPQDRTTGRDANVAP